MKLQLDFSGKVGMVTAAGSGIGRAIALGAGALGASIVIVDRDADAAAETAAGVVELGAKAITVAADCQSEPDVLHAFEELDRAFARIDLMFANVGGSVHVPPEDLDLATWNGQVALNLTSTFLVAREAGRRMLRQGSGGAIVAMSSIAGGSALGRGSLPYSVSKAGVQQLCKELAIQWGRAGIRVNAIQPAQTQSPGFLRALQSGALDKILGQDAMARFLSAIPLGRLGNPEDAAAAALFLASDLASWVTGVTLPVDGGNLAMNAGASI